MSFTVRELPKVRQDKDSIARWLYERSPEGAVAWLEAYDRMIERLETHADAFGEAPESSDCELSVQQTFFKTRRDRVYRALFFIDGDLVYILRIRGPGQAPVAPDAMK